MATGFSLHIGVNQTDEKHYPGLSTLAGAVYDAFFWRDFAKSLGYQTRLLTDEEAKSETVLETMRAIKNQMRPGDIFLVTYAGHGGYMENDKQQGLNREPYNQTWCLYDRQLIDDEIFECFKLFDKGTRILVVSDSCHSGTVTRDGEVNFNNFLNRGMTRTAAEFGLRSRKVPTELQRQIQQRNQSTYSKIQKNYETVAQAEGLMAAVKLLAACQDDEETLDGEKNGIFTEAFIEIFKSAAGRSANAEQLIEMVKCRYFFPRPNYFGYGAIIPSYDASFPFLIDIPDATRIEGYLEPKFDQLENDIRKRPTFVADDVDLELPAVLDVTLIGKQWDNVVDDKKVKVLQRSTWAKGECVTIELTDVPIKHSWEAAHALQSELSREGFEVLIEPVISVNPAYVRRATREGDINNPDYIPEWPPSLQQGKVKIGWHLDDAHSQLSSAFQTVAKKADSHIRIAHFDTGYIADHSALPAKLNKSLAHSFVPGESPNQAIDPPESGQDGHGLGTIVLLAGGQVSLSDTFNEYQGFVGGAPLAEVVPVRIAESVVIFNSTAFCNAVDYAIQHECEVISMSMAGKPSAKMADAVNRAYEAGIVIVSAASNCWYKGVGALLPKCVMFPAAFDRVLAATGAMYDQKPYDVNYLQKKRFNITTRYMQGSWGPPSRMKKALAAYTPNTPWASTHYKFLRSGGGTSSATPQVAAAAALWIAHHRDQLIERGYYTKGNQWKKVEAVRYALYKSAAKDEVFGEYKKYYGNGILRAASALQVIPNDSELVKSSPAETSFGGLLDTVSSFFKNRTWRSENVKLDSGALAWELLHLLQTDPQFYQEFSQLDLDDEKSANALLNSSDFRKRVVSSTSASLYLKKAIAAQNSFQ
ncbi:MAG TPA: S8 family serine peptidase [Chryseosolibacter sp.]